MIRDGVDDEDLIETAIERGWLARPREAIDVQRMLAAQIDRTYRDELAERGSPSPIPDDPYLR
jgi:hypothetical protein